MDKAGDPPMGNKIRYAGAYNLTGTPIVIDGNSQWASTAAGNDWCYFDSGYYIIENVTIDGLQSDSCITIMNSNTPFIIRNCTLYNAYWDGPEPYKPPAGIYMEEVENGVLTNNNCSYNSGYGVWALNCAHLVISHNIFSNNTGAGMRTYFDDSDEIYGNTAFCNEGGGIEVFECNYTNVFNNEIYEHTGMGIYLSNGLYNTATNNTLYNDSPGIYISDDNSTITLNNISDCGGGITLVGAYHNNVSKNVIKNSLYRGIKVDRGSNKFWLNYLYNLENVYEDTTELNYWDNGSIGNYYSDYSGKDVNDDGVGDSVYDIPGRTGNLGQDNYPIWWDAPVVSITNPTTDEQSESAPSYEVSIDEGIADTMWYTLDGGITNITFASLTGTIDEIKWGELSDDPLTLTFYVNDSKGYIGKAEVNMSKVSDIPDITIDTPTTNQKFGAQPPEFTITISDLSTIIARWYTIDEGVHYYNFTGLTAIIATDTWNNASEGDVILRIYVMDEVGHIGTKSITFLKQLPEAIPGYNVILIIGMISSIILLVTKKHKHKTKI